MRRPLYLAFAHLLLALHVHGPALLLHLHRALLHLLLAGLLLLCGLRAFALLRLHLRLPLLLHVLLTCALLRSLFALCLHSRLPRLLLKLALLQLDFLWALLRGRAIAG